MLAVRLVCGDWSGPCCHGYWYRLQKGNNTAARLSHAHNCSALQWSLQYCSIGPTKYWNHLLVLACIAPDQPSSSDDLWSVVLIDQYQDKPSGLRQKHLCLEHRVNYGNNYHQSWYTTAHSHKDQVINELLYLLCESGIFPPNLGNFARSVVCKSDLVLTICRNPRTSWSKLSNKI